MALTIHVELAVRCAAGQLAGGPLSPDTSKKLWLRVARYRIAFYKKVFRDSVTPFSSETFGLALDPATRLDPDPHS